MSLYLAHWLIEIVDRWVTRGFFSVVARGLPRALTPIHHVTPFLSPGVT